MTEQEILDNSPEGATHSEKYLYLKFETYWYVWESEWVRCGLNIQCYDNIRSLSDIKRIAELEREAASHKKALGDIVEGYASAVYELEQLKAAQPEWISVDNPPPNNKRVFVLAGGRISIGKYNPSDRFGKWSLHFGCGAITHWMHFNALPAPPEK